MANSPPGVKRIVSVLNFFAAHPGQAFTFTDIVRALKLGRATCHALLTGLVEAGYLYRNPDKTYVPGPTLVNLSQAVIQQFSPLQALQPELRKLADDFGVIASAIGRDGGEVVILAKAGSGTSIAWANAPIGDRLPLRIPYVGTFFAWAERSELERWIGTHGNTVGAEQMEIMERAMAFVRQRGFNFMTRNPTLPATTDRRRLFSVAPSGQAPAIMEGSLEAAQVYELSSVTAPIFGRDGEVAMVLALTGFALPQTGADILSMGETLVSACERLTVFVGGKKPGVGRGAGDYGLVS